MEEIKLGEKRIEHFLSLLKDEKKFRALWKQKYFIASGEQIELFIYRCPSDTKFAAYLASHKEIDSVYKKLAPIINFEDYNPDGFVALWRSNMLIDCAEEITAYLKEHK